MLDILGKQTKQLHGKYHFVYHCWEDGRSSDAILWKHTRQPCTIIEIHSMEIADRVEIGQMYKVRFNDGLEYDVFFDELTRKLKG